MSARLKYELRDLGPQLDHNSRQNRSPKHLTLSMRKQIGAGSISQPTQYMNLMNFAAMDYGREDLCALSSVGRRTPNGCRSNTQALARLERPHGTLYGRLANLPLKQIPTSDLQTSSEVRTPKPHLRATPFQTARHRLSDLDPNFARASSTKTLRA